MAEIAFTLCSNNYLAQAKTLADSFIFHNPTYDFIIGLVDKKHSEIDYSFFQPHQIIEVSQVGISDNENMISRYNIVEYNTAVKPFYFQYIFKNYQTESVTYFDPDIRVYAPLDELKNIYTHHDFILTPHLLKAEPFTVPDKEQLILNVGVFNLGFLGLKRGIQSDLFLEFFQTRMRDKCYIDFCMGLFVDQIWANLIPCYFDNYYIWKDPGCNVGYWNFSERKLSTGGGSKYLINDHHALKFFHISNYNPLKPDKLCKHLPYSFDVRPDLKQLYDAYGLEVLANNYALLSTQEPLFSFQKNHPVLDKKPQKKITYSRRNRWGQRVKNVANKTINWIFGLN